MPIKGISDVIRLPRLGKLRLGIRREVDGGVSYPCPTDYFVCPDEVKKVFGDKPREIRIMFPTEEPSQWASQYLRCYSASGSLVCRGDGEVAVARIDSSTGMLATASTVDSELREISCSPLACPHHQVKHCRRVMNLQFLLPDCPGFGVYQLNTGSYHSIINVNSSLELVRGVCGRLSMIPLTLRLVERQVQPNGIRKTAWVLSLTAPFSLVDIQKYAQIPPEKALLLPPSDSEAPDDLFPEDALGSPMSEPHPSAEEDRLLQLWARAKHLIWHRDVRDEQIATWFRKNCKLNVSLADFHPPKPPTWLTAEHLSYFCEDIERYTTGN